MTVSPAGVAWILLNGLGVTLLVSGLAFVVIVIVGAAAGVALVWGNAPVRVAVRLYVEFFRGTSIFFQLFWIYFVLPGMGLTLPPLAAAVVALGLNGAAYFAETVRAAILAVPREQTEACVSLNLTLRQRVLRVILPQAAVIVLPPLGNTAIETLKGSSLVSLIALNDLTFQALMMRMHIGSSLIPILLLLVIYYIMSKAIDLVFRRVERRLATGLDGLRD